MLTVKELHEALDYDPETGVFRYKLTRRRGWVGKTASHIKPGYDGGYNLVSVNGTQFRGARLAWLYMTGAWPDQDVDHIDRNRANDAWSNLRLASRGQNMANGTMRVDNTSGFRGVTWNAATNSWRAQVIHRSRNYYCGLYETPEEAAAARDVKAAILHGEFVRLNVQ